jgi:hypothetical protein
MTRWKSSLPSLEKKNRVMERRKWPEKEQHKYKTEPCEEQLHLSSRTSCAQFKSNKNLENIGCAAEQIGFSLL